MTRYITILLLSIVSIFHTTAQDAGGLPETAIPISINSPTILYADTVNTCDWGFSAGDYTGKEIYYNISLPERMNLIVHNLGSIVRATEIRIVGDNGEVQRSYNKDKYQEWLFTNDLWNYDSYNYDIAQDCFIANNLPQGNYYIIVRGIKFYNNNATNGEIHTSVTAYTDDYAYTVSMPEDNYPGGEIHPISLGIYDSDFSIHWSKNLTEITKINPYLIGQLYFDFNIRDDFNMHLSPGTGYENIAIFSVYGDEITILPVTPDNPDIPYTLFKGGKYIIRLDLASSDIVSLSFNGKRDVHIEPPPYSIYNPKTVGKNFVRTRTYLDADGSEYREETQFVDGLGRPSQRVVTGGSPTGSDLVWRTDYDGSGRTAAEWLPGVSATGGGAYALPGAVDYSIYGGDSSPYQSIVYEPSPLNRVSARYGAGDRWRREDAAVRYSYDLSLSTGHELSCFVYDADNTADHPSAPVTVRCSGRYGAGELKATKVTGEDGNVTIIFTDGFDRKVLERRALGDGTYADTYFVYDGYDNLTAVLPPEASARMAHTGVWSALSSEELRDYCYLYRYDYQRRMVGKRLPGCEEIETVYDSADRPVLWRDGNLRSMGLWAFRLTDIFGRETLSGTCSAWSGKLHTIPAITSRTTDRIDPAVSNGATSTLMGYDIYILELTDPVVLTATYYDDYSFVGSRDVPGMPGEDVLGFEGCGGFGSPYPSAKGHVTGTVVAAGEPSDTAAVYLYTAMYYDDRDREIFRASTNAVDGTDRLWTAYDFTGNVTSTCRTHSSQLAAEVSHTERYRHEYDRMGRQLATWHSIDGADEVQLSAMDYDAVGRLATERSGGDVPFLSREYAYNIRGWLTSSVADGYTEHLTYTHGGNVSRLKWRALFGTERWYDCSYDALDRLTGAVYGDSEGGNGRMDTSYGYDLNGNMTSLMRVGMYSRDMFGVKYGTIDNVTLEYSGNRLLRATDAMGTPPVYKDAFHFADGTDESVEYTYDSNGNQSADLNRGILSTTYDINNRPRSIRFSSGARTDYLYDASGTKLRTIHTIPSVPPAVPMEGCTDEESIVSTTDYSGGYIYENGTVDRLLTTNGFVTFAADGTPAYHYYLKDYLGNVRAVISHDGSVEQTAHYYPFGSLMATTEYQPEVTHPNRHLYGGKELDRTSGLDLLDFEARAYAPLLPRFRSMDPLCYKYYDISPYAYCANNPFRNIDLHGDSITVLSEPSGAGYAGHMAILIQNEDGTWSLYSKNGTDENCGFWGTPDKDDKAVGNYSSPEAFLDSDKNKDNDETKYTKAYVIPTTKEEDQTVRDAVKAEIDKNYYNVATANCAQLVQTGLRAIGKNDGRASVIDFAIGCDISIKLRNPHHVISRTLGPNYIFKRIAKNNPGRLIKK